MIHVRAPFAECPRVKQDFCHRGLQVVVHHTTLPQRLPAPRDDDFVLPFRQPSSVCSCDLAGNLSFTASDQFVATSIPAMSYRPDCPKAQNLLLPTRPCDSLPA